VNAALITGLSGNSGIAVSGSDLFEVNRNINGTVGEYTTSGATLNASLITASFPNGYPSGLAISGSNVFVSIDGNQGYGGLYPGRRPACATLRRALPL